MVEKKQSYLEKQLEASIKFEPEQITLTFQKEKVKLEDELEIALLREVNPFIEKEITLTEDELKFTYKKEPSYFTFSKLRSLDEKSRWMFASNVLKTVMLHSSHRLHAIICPENLLIDESLTPYFLHYGVKESIPPYERNDERLLNETKAMIAAAVEPKYTFDQYIQFSNSIELSAVAREVVEAKDTYELLHMIKKQLLQIEKDEKRFTKITRSKLNWFRYSLVGLILVLLPLGIYTAYSGIVTQPRQEAYIAVQGPYIQGNYSEIIDTLAKYKVEDMPEVIQYELSLAYIVNETLTEQQRDNVLKTITLQTDPRYFQYWIYIGRGQTEEALSLARQLEDLDYIMLALLHHEEAVKANRDLKDEERKQQLNDIKTEKDEIQKQLEELEEALELEGENKTDVDTTSSGSESTETETKTEPKTESDQANGESQEKEATETEEPPSSDVSDPQAESSNEQTTDSSEDSTTNE